MRLRALSVSLGQSIATLAAVAIPAIPAVGAVRGELIAPQSTDPGIRELTEFPSYATRDLRHYAAIDLAVLRRNQLMLFMPGTGGAPGDYRQIADLGASLGFHVVSIAHPNFPAIEDLVGGNGDPQEPERIRNERLYGLEESALVSVGWTDSLMNRTVKLIQYLESTHPGEGWGSYLDASASPPGSPAGQGVPTLRWTTVVAVGHSHGAGFAGFLTKFYPVSGAVYVSGPGELVDYTPQTAASWDLRPSLIPTSRQYGLVHNREPARDAWQFCQRAFGLDAFGVVTSVDGASPPYGGSHMLITDLTPAVAGAFHSSTAVDRFAHKQPDGTATLMPAWRHMLLSAPRAACGADINCTGDVTVQDIFDYLAAYFAGEIRADVNGSGALTVQDIFDFLGVYFVGCP